MRTILVLLLSLLLAGCINLSSPQGAQYKAEYANRLNIRTQNVYRFMNKAVRPMGDSNAQDDYLAGFFSLSGAENSILELRFNYPAKSLQVTSLDRQNHVIAERTYLLLDKSEAPPTNKDIDYFYLTKDGELQKNSRSCIPDMSVGCMWWNHTLFITHNLNLAMQYEEGGAILAFLVIPIYNSKGDFKVFPKAMESTIIR